uniref:Rho-GAP domain-containing protein n=1 Tax=Syphacia muris TaxID=451379 RepID=A0A0N5B0G5_9BILA
MVLAFSIKKLDEQEHFHYTSVNIRHIFLRLAAVHFESSSNDHELLIEVASNDNVWIVKRSYSQLVEFDYQLHRCVFDRSYSKLRELGRLSNVTGKSFRIAVEKYFQRLSQLTAKSITCFPILRFLEVDNRGNRFLPAEETCINTPAIATAIVTKNYASKNNFEISLSVNFLLVLFVGLFPSDCVQLLDSKSTTPNTSLKAKPKRVVRPRERSLIRVFLRRIWLLDSNAFAVPIILKKCVEVIERYGIVTGVYRQCGIQSNVQKLRNAFDTGLISEVFTEGILRDVHCVSSLLKQYFRQLPNPLFTFTLYSQFVVSFCIQTDYYFRTAKFLISHLAKLSRCAHLTDMNSKNLAIVWAPNLFRPPPCPTNNDIHALQGLNVQTGLCNYIILHAVHLFSLDDTVTTFVAPGTSICSRHELKTSIN